MANKIKISDLLNEVSSRTSDEHLVRLFKNAFFDTKEKAVKYIDDEAFLITGDIPAMWLRDSSAQVAHYLPFAHEDEIRKLIRGLLKRQLRMIIIDPYANAFKEKESDYGEWDTTAITNEHSKIVWERKFELDSLCYPLWLLCKYYEETRDDSIFDELFYQAFDRILNVIEIESHHEECSDYFFGYTFTDKQRIEPGKNVGSSFSPGLVWSGFRPSDDICQYHYHIPDNIFLVSVLYKLEDIFVNVVLKPKYAKACHDLIIQVREGIERFGTAEVEGIGKVYVSETDCKGHYSLNDDANIPSLLSLPYLEYPFLDKGIYENTRRNILSFHNDFYYEGTCLKGIGSPHTPKNHVWPLALIMQGLTSNDDKEIQECLAMLLRSDNNTDMMHESINVKDPSVFTRAWFGWANSLFAEFCLKKVFKLI